MIMTQIIGEKSSTALQERVEGFNKDLAVLLKTYRLNLVAEVRVINGLVVGIPQVTDAEAKPAPETPAEEKNVTPNEENKPKE